MNPRDFWDEHGGLVWSYAAADDSIHLRAALVRPGFDRLLKIAIEFGIDRLRQEWQILAEEQTPEAKRASPAVERILTNIEKGFCLAASGD